MNWFGEERFITDAWERRIPTVRLWEDEGGDYYFEVGMLGAGVRSWRWCTTRRSESVQRATIHVHNGFTLAVGGASNSFLTRSCRSKVTPANHSSVPGVKAGSLWAQLRLSDWWYALVCSGRSKNETPICTWQILSPCRKLLFWHC